ncbi:AHH domain-containing protein [Parendozoicomonas sp. Alg238-R29]|uniref:AHH domain-containing protein n=1 Tax=Parendozoicomonas sp. Alg238-R29 TaxID=2993446 RepID=UPI00248DE671|nr:AHH domain-containing protein [Parendozoicomonas sp. Alg238-R29]
MVQEQDVELVEEHELRIDLEFLLKETQCRMSIDELVEETKTRSLFLALASYRKHGYNMSPSELRAEKHKSSRLGENLIAIDKEKPHGDFEAHHIVAGGAKRARRARKLLASLGIRVDDPINGVWLPNYVKNVPHPEMKEAYPHRPVHTPSYYLNIENILTQTMSRDQAHWVLNKVARELQTSSFPIDRKMTAQEIEMWMRAEQS